MAKVPEGWFEERLGLKAPISWFLNRKVPRGVGWWYTLGSATAVTFIILVMTGLFLMMTYSPSPDHAYHSLPYILNAVPFAHLIHAVRHWAPSAMLGLVGLHGLRTFFMGAYKYPRELTWIIGSLLFILVMGASFTGYLLPWDQRAYWATNVGTGIAGQAPFLGLWIQKVLIGGNTIGAVTLTRFFTFHVGIVAPLIAVLAAIHIMLVVKQGISAPPKK